MALIDLDAPAQGGGLIDLDAPQPERGDFLRGAKVAFQQVPQLGYGLAAITAAAIETAAGEGGLATSAKNWATKGYEDWGASIQAGAKESDEFDIAYERAKEGDFGSLVDWAQYGIGYGVGQGVQILGTAGVGALGGKLLLKPAVEKVLGGMVEKEAAKLVAQGIAADVARRQAVASIATQAGAVSAMAAQSFGMEGGEIGGELAAESVKEGRTLTGSELARAAGATALAGAFEFAGDVVGLQAITGKLGLGKTVAEAAGLKGRAARGLVSAAIAAPTEAGTEYLQTGVEEYGKGKEENVLTWNQSEEAQRHAKNAAALGAVGGGVMGGGGGFLTSPTQAEDFKPADKMKATGDAVVAAPNADAAIQTATALSAEPLTDVDLVQSVSGGLVQGAMGSPNFDAAQDAATREAGYAEMERQRQENAEAAVRRSGMANARFSEQETAAAAQARAERDAEIGVLAREQAAQDVARRIQEHDAKGLTTTTAVSYRAALVRRLEELGFEAPAVPQAAAKEATIAAESAAEIVPELGTIVPEMGTVDVPKTAQIQPAPAGTMEDAAPQEGATPAAEPARPAPTVLEADRGRTTPEIVAGLPSEKERVLEQKPAQQAPAVRINGQTVDQMTVQQLQHAAATKDVGGKAVPKNVPYADQQEAAAKELKRRDKKGETVMGREVHQLTDAELTVVARKGKTKTLRESAAAEITKREAADKELEANLKGHADLVKSFADSAGWAQRGGHLIRVKHGERAGEETLSRTQWIPRAEWWPTRPVQEGEQFYKEAVAKAMAGGKLTRKQKDVVRFLVGLAQDQRSGVTLEGTVTAEELLADEIEPTVDNQARQEILDRLGAVDPDALERLSMQMSEATDEEFMAAVVAQLKERENANQRADEADGAAGAQEGAQARAAEEVAERTEALEAEARKWFGGRQPEVIAERDFTDEWLTLDKDSENYAADLQALLDQHRAAREKQFAPMRKAEAEMRANEQQAHSAPSELSPIQRDFYGALKQLSDAQLADLAKALRVSNRGGRDAIINRLDSESHLDVAKQYDRLFSGKLDSAPVEITGTDLQPAQQLFVQFGGERFEVASLEDASRKWEKFRDATGKGASVLGGAGALKITDQNGKEVGRISYNGRVFPPGEWKSGMKPLYDPVAGRAGMDADGRYSMPIDAPRPRQIVEGDAKAAAPDPLTLQSPTEADLQDKERQAETGNVEERTAAVRDRNEAILTPPEGTAPAREITEAQRQPTEQQGLFGTAVAALREAADKIERAASPEAKAPKRAAPATGEARITDTGENLWYNRRNFTGKATSWDDVKGLNETLKVKEVVKSKVWPKPDYEQLVAEGMQPLFARLLKQVYDGIAVSPSGKEDADLQRYIAVVNRVREAVFDWAKDNNANRAFLESAMEMMKPSGQRASITSMYGTAEFTQAVLTRIWPESFVEGRYRMTQETKADLRAIGGNRPYRALQFDIESMRDAVTDLQKGWPKSQEQWQRQGYRITPVSQAVISEGQRFDFDSQQRVPTWRVFTKDGWGGRQIGEEHESKEAAEESRRSLKPFLLLDKNSRLVSQHDTEAQAQEAARELTKREAKGGDIRGMNIGQAEREGPARRENGENITSERLKDAFGFRGVNFGREGWINQTERQAYLNHAYDGLLDLAELLEVPPKALSLNGMLGIAFGAQGRGGHAAAHFVPGHNEINLTKTMGAGTLAHEWGHALDHYFATQGALAKDSEPFMSAHSGDLQNRMAVRRLRQESLPEVRPEIVAAFKAVVETMEKRPMTEAEVAAQRQMAHKRTLDQLEKWIQHFRKDVERNAPADLDKFDKQAERLRKGDRGDGLVKAGGQVLSEPVAKIKALIKGMQGQSTNIPSNWKGLESNASHVAYVLEQKEATKTHQPQTTNTAYAAESSAKDGAKGGKRYWRTRWEMFARAFETWVADKLAEKTQSNTFLSDAALRAEARDKNGGFAMPYPRGEDRARINEAMGKLVAEIQTKETDKGVAMFSRAYHGSPHDFDRFNLDKIGTGEGAQAYGWGLYFAGKKEVAEHYRNTLSPRGPATLERELDVPMDQADALWAAARVKVGDLKSEMSAESLLMARSASLRKLSDAERASLLQRAVEVFQAPRGRLYEVELAPKEDEYLDWDKPLSEQSAHVQDIVRSRLGWALGNLLRTYPNSSGREIYRGLSKQLGGDIAASMRLDREGILGIRYLDGSSRTRSLRDIKREFLSELPEDANFDEVNGLVGGGTFSPANEAILKALAADDWLGFDYPAQALGAALGGDLSKFDASPALVQAVADAQQGGTYNYVIFDDKHAKIEAKFSRRPAYTTDADGRPLLDLGDLRIADPQPIPGMFGFGGGTPYQHNIVQGDRVVAVATLNWKDGKVRDLLHIRTHRNLRGQGIAEAVVSGILSHNDGDPLRAVYVVSKARGFWEKMGAEFVATEDGEDGILNQENYADAAGLREDARQGGRRPGEGAGQAALGEGEAGSGDAGGSTSDQAVAVRQALAPILGAWKNAPEVVVHDSIQDPAVPQEIREADQGQRSAGAEGAPEGVFWDGKVHIFADQVQPQNAARVLFHEALGHYGLRGVFGNRLDRVLESVAKAMPGRVKAKAEAYGFDLKNADQRLQAAEEVLAELAQTRPEMGFVRQAIAAIRQFLREIGFDLKLSDNDIVANFILPARDFVEGSDAKTESAGIRLMSDSVTRDPDPAEAAEVETAVTGATPQEAARWLSENGREYQKIIAGRALVQLQRLKAAGVKLDLKVSRVGETVPLALLGARGLTVWKFAEKDNHITAWLNGADVTGKVGVSKEVLLHELVHMATAGVVHLGNLKSAEGSKAAEDVADLYKVTNHVVRHFNQRVADSRAGKARLTEFENRMFRRANNAFASADETLAWALSNKEAQEYLESIPYPAHKSAWSAFVEAVRKALGIPARMETALSEVLRVAENLMGENVNELIGLDTVDGENTGIQAEANSGILAARDGTEVPRFSRAPAIGGSVTTGDVRDALSAGVVPFVRNLLQSDAKFNWWHRTVGTQQHKALLNREFAPVYDESQAFLSDVSKYANEAADQATDLLPRIDQFKDFAKKTPSTADLDRAVDALYAGTLWGGGSPTEGRIWTEAELRSGRARDGNLTVPAFQPLNDAQIALYKQALAATGTSLEGLGKSLIAKLLRSHGMGIDREMAMPDVVAVAVEQINEAMADATLAMQEAESRGDDRGAQKAFDEGKALEDLKKAVEDIAGKTQKLIDRGYFPAMRFGQFAVHVLEPQADGKMKQLYFGMFESQTKANLAAQALRKQYPDAVIDKGIVSKEQYKLFQGLSLDALETFADYITDENGTPIAKDPLVQGFLKAAVSERSTLKRHIHRKGVTGYSNDLPRVLASFVTSTARAVSSNYHSAQMLKFANEVKAGDVKDEAIKLVRYLQDPMEEAQAIRGFLFAQFLGGSIAHGLVNMTQPFMVTIPYLSQHTSAADAAAKMVEAVGTKPSELTGRIREAYERAKKEGVVAPQEIHQLRAESAGMPLGRSLAMRKLSFLWGSIYAVTEQFNRTTAFLAAYRVAEAKNWPDPYTFARKAVNETQFVYNKGNRPNWARGAVGATVFTFKQFSISYLELGKRMYAKDKKAFALMALMLVAAAGLEGAPFAEDIEDLIDTIGQWMGYGTNSKKKVRQWATDLLGPDLAQVALRGISGLSWMPVDVSIRMGMQNLIPGSAMLKPSEKNKARDVLELVGPVGQFVPTEGTMMGRALERLAHGDWFGVLKSGAPVAVQNLTKGAEMLDRGYATDTKGKKITEVSPGEAVLKMAGLQPASVAKESRKIGEVMQDIDIQRRTESEIADRWARAIVDDKPDEVRAAMKQLHDWNRDNEDLRIRITMEQIRRRVKEMKTPREQRFVKSAPPEIRAGVRDALR